jgi:hypothetical protein
MENIQQEGKEAVIWKLYERGEPKWRELTNFKKCVKCKIEVDL